VDHVDGRGVVRLVDQHRQLVVGEGHILDGRWRISATPISTGTVRVRGLWRRRKMNNRRLLSGVDNGSSVLDLWTIVPLVASASSVSFL